MLKSPLKTKTAKIHEPMSLSLKPELRDTLIMMATGADAAKRKATKAFKNSLSKTLYEPLLPTDVCFI
jgi:hypothetical protein